MRNLIFPDNYQSVLNIVETQNAIKLIKSTFEMFLSEKLDLKRVSAPIMVDPKTGLNDNLNGVEKAISFKLSNGQELEIVHSLAKWKRFALNKYNLSGLYTDMNAIRPCEELDNLHSLYVDQWDWEKVISKEERNLGYLKSVVDKIYESIRLTHSIICKTYDGLEIDMADKITYITSQELLSLYPDKTNVEREYLFTKEHKAVFIIGIGKTLDNGTKHDNRASDYDDWDLNGDLLLWDETLNRQIEISSMGIRVDGQTLLEQLKKSNEEYKINCPYHQMIINKELPLTIGGGIGQSRLCMYLLKKAHIGEVQSSYWSKEDIEAFEKANIHLL